MQGKLIVLEGVDGCGSTTQAQLLADRLRKTGGSVHATREPSDGPVGKLIRQALSHQLVETRNNPDLGVPYAPSWETMALLFAADRTDHVNREILPALERGETVVSDRYDLSSLIYQSLTVTGNNVLEWTRVLNARIPRPDLTLVIDVSPEMAEQRRTRRGGVIELFETSDLQRRLCEAYHRTKEFVPHDLVVMVPGDGTVNDIAELIWRSVHSHLP
jgi:dTMP kinase